MQDPDTGYELNSEVFDNGCRTDHDCFFDYLCCCCGANGTSICREGVTKAIYEEQLRNSK